MARLNNKIRPGKMESAASVVEEGGEAVAKQSRSKAQRPSGSPSSASWIFQEV
jgi:hypothetical protein